MQPARRHVLAFAVFAALLCGSAWRIYARTSAESDILAAERRAGESHAATLALFDAIDDDQAKADALEDGPLPLWREALAIADAEGADVAVKRLHLRTHATELLIDAFRTGDEAQLRSAEHAWETAERTGRVERRAATR